METAATASVRENVTEGEVVVADGGDAVVTVAEADGGMELVTVDSSHCRSARLACRQHQSHRQIDRYLMFYTQATVKGHIRTKQNVFLPQVQILIHYSIHIPPLRIEDIQRK